MELDYIREFCCVVRQKNISKAADNLFLSQSTLSRHIAELEKELSTELIRRNNREFELTEAGKTFYEEMSPFLDHMERMKSKLQKIQKGLRGKIAVASLYPYIPVIFDKVEAYQRTFPEIAFHIVQYKMDDVANAVLSENIDLGITFDFAFQSDHHLESRPIARDKLVLVCAPSHPLAGRVSVEAADLCDEVVLRSQSLRFPFLESFVDRILHMEQAGNSATSVGEEVNLETAILRSRLGEGILILPRSFAEEYARGCALVPIAEPNTDLNICMLWRRDSHNLALGRFLAGLE